MSVVVAIKEGNKVYVGSDSQVTKGGTRTTLKNPNNYKIWKVDDKKHCMMAHVGLVRDANIIRLMTGVVDDYDEFADRVNYRFVVKYLVPEIIKNLKDAHYLKMSDGFFDQMESCFLFIYKNQIYSISSDGCVIEIDDYVAIGSGAQEAVGSLISTKGLDPEKRIVRAIRASAANDIYVDYPIILGDTETEEFKVIAEKDAGRYLSNSSTKKGDTE